MVFSIMLWMPSWGGMINGLMTLSGAWDKIRTDPIIRMMVMAVAFYGMSTFEGPMMSIKAVNSLSHYTDWTIGHVHSGALGWVGMITFGAIYYLVPKLWNRERLYSLRLVNWHFWLATLGIVLYAAVMWVSGIMQGLMWREYDEQGFLVYSFAETVAAMHPYYVMRALGGAALPRRRADHGLQRLHDHPRLPARRRADAAAPSPAAPARRIRRHNNVHCSTNTHPSNATPRCCWSARSSWSPSAASSRSRRSSTSRTPSRRSRACGPTRRSSSPGRNIYVREGCYVCHSQMIRPFRDEVERYGHYSLAAESMYDHPFQWGSKRTGPDLARVGDRYSDDWHVQHLIDPRSVVPESIMPSYAFLKDTPTRRQERLDAIWRPTPRSACPIPTR